MLLLNAIKVYYYMYEESGIQVDARKMMYSKCRGSSEEKTYALAGRRW